MGSSFGRLFRITTWGESHGGGVGVVIDGCPPGLALSELDIQPDLDRRRPGQSRLVSPRNEADRVRILSGVFEGRTLGSPISLMVENTDADSSKYLDMKDLYRPSHADYTYEAKFGVRNWQGGGRASARETIGRVAAGAVARKLLKERCGVEVLAWVSAVGELEADIDPTTVQFEAVEANPVRCPSETWAEKMEALITEVRKARDTIGGVITGVARGVPAGWGEPVFDKLEADLAKAMLSLPACKGFESGSGFLGSRMRGSAHNDPFELKEGRVRTTSNFSGGIQGGISNGEDILIRTAFKPVATHFLPQQTVTTTGESTTFSAKGRHDPCVLPRAVPMVEAMMLLVLADHFLRQVALRPPNLSTGA